MPESVDSFAALVANVYELAGALRRHGEEIAGRVGQTQARWQVLSVVSAGDWTVPRIAQRLGISRQAVQRVTDDLRADGLLHYGDNPDHRRSPLVELTDVGRDALAEITAAAQAWHREVTTGLDRVDLVRTNRDISEILSCIDTARRVGDSGS